MMHLSALLQTVFILDGINHYPRLYPKVLIQKTLAFLHRCDWGTSAGYDDCITFGNMSFTRFYRSVGKAHLCKFIPFFICHPLSLSINTMLNLSVFLHAIAHRQGCFGEKWFYIFQYKFPWQPIINFSRGWFHILNDGKPPFVSHVFLGKAHLSFKMGSA